MGARGRGALRFGLALAAALALAAEPARAGEGVGRLQGNVSLSVEGVSIANVGPIVVFLQPERPVDAAPGAAKSPEMSQHNARFSPGFLAVAKGQRIEMPNDDDIDHNVYSASGKNRFDLGVYQAGEKRAIQLQHPGQVDIHCSIHESMNATIFVSPSPWFARVQPGGAFTIEGLPPGRYRLRTWSQLLPRSEMYLRVRAGETAHANVVIGTATGEL